MSTSPPLVSFFLATSGHSGVDRLMRNLIPAVARRGYAVDQLKVRRHGPDIAPMPGVRVVDLGTRHVYSSLWSLTRYLHRERPAVLLSDKDKVNRTAVIARSLAGVETRLILRSGTTISEDLAHRGWFDRLIQRLSMSYLYRKGSAVLVPSRASAIDLQQFTRLPSRLIRTVPSPIAEARWFDSPQLPAPAHRFFSPGAPPVVLGVGELSPRKDFSTLLRGFAIARKQHECRLIVLGRGGQLGALRAEAAQLGIQDDVDFPGYSDQVPAYMSHCAVFVLTSRWEGMPVVLIEALACGAAVISTDSPGGSRELLQQGALGDLIEIGDHQALAAALSRRLMAPAERERWRAAARPYEIESATTAYLAAMGLPAQA